jgi:hypothetical protein
MVKAVALATSPVRGCLSRAGVPDVRHVRCVIVPLITCCRLQQTSRPLSSVRQASGKDMPDLAGLRQIGCVMRICPPSVPHV